MARGGIRRYLSTVEPSEYIPDCGEVDLSELSLTGLADLFGSDKGSIKHRYTSVYQDIIADLLDGRSRKQAQLKIVEFGVACGASLRMWSNYLPKSIISGFDIRPQCSNLCLDLNNVRIYVDDVTSASSIDASEAFEVTVDLIVDDASHVAENIVAAFTNSWEKLRPGGYYVIEDLKCTYTDAYTSRFRKKFDENAINDRNSILLLLDKLMRLTDAGIDVSEIKYYSELLVVKKL